MSKNNLTSVNDLLDKEFGKVGSKTRDEFRKEAYDFCIGHILRDARKEQNKTQSDVADLIGADKSYISRIENGEIQPSAGVFWRIIEGLGLKIEITSL